MSSDISRSLFLECPFRSVAQKPHLFISPTPFQACYSGLQLPVATGAARKTRRLVERAFGGTLPRFLGRAWNMPVRLMAEPLGRNRWDHRCQRRKRSVPLSGLLSCRTARASYMSRWMRSVRDGSNDQRLP